MTSNTLALEFGESCTATKVCMMVLDEIGKLSFCSAFYGMYSVLNSSNAGLRISLRMKFSS